MKTIRILGREVGLELWCRLTEVRAWQLGTEQYGRTSLLWLGPLHLAVCRY